MNFSVKAPKPDPQIAAAQAQQQQIADTNLTKGIQGDLQSSTRRRLQAYGFTNQNIAARPTPGSQKAAPASTPNVAMPGLMGAIYSMMRSRTAAG